MIRGTNTSHHAHEYDKLMSVYGNKKDRSVSRSCRNLGCPMYMEPQWFLITTEPETGAVIVENDFECIECNQFCEEDYDV